MRICPKCGCELLEDYYLASDAPMSVGKIIMYKLSTQVRVKADICPKCGEVSLRVHPEDLDRLH